MAPKAKTVETWPRMRLIGWLSLCYIVACVAAAIVTVSIIFFNDKTTALNGVAEFFQALLVGIFLIAFWTALPAALIIGYGEKRQVSSIRYYALGGLIASVLALLFAFRINLANFPFELLAAVAPGGIAGGFVFGWLRLRKPREHE